MKSPRATFDVGFAMAKRQSSYVYAYSDIRQIHPAADEGWGVGKRTAITEDGFSEKSARLIK
jgi:hypothetical protein